MSGLIQFQAYVDPPIQNRIYPLGRKKNPQFH